jgi:manganese/zinc/iron transport system permease protein
VSDNRGLLLFVSLLGAVVVVAALATGSALLSPETTATDGPTFAERLLRVVSLRDPNTRFVLLGTLLLGTTAGIVGTFMLLRRQALVGDVVSHAALPGVAVAFIVGELIAPGSGRDLKWLLCGAALAGLASVVCVNLIRRFSRINPDAILATVLGVFFGFGAVMFKVVQQMKTGGQAGLNHFILGSAATITPDDIRLIASAGLVVLVLCLLLFKEMKLLCFDEGFAIAEGWPVFMLDITLTGLVVAVTVIGLKSVGILMVALLITPPTAARFWTENLGKMIGIAAGIGGVSAVLGSLASALFDKLAGGPTIVLTGTMFFLISLMFGTERGIVCRWLRHRKTQRRIGRADLLRAMFEIIESRVNGDGVQNVERLTTEAVEHADLVSKRSWTAHRVNQIVSRGVHEGIVRMDSERGWRLTHSGAREASRAVRNHRMWELYLITQADIAPSHVDRDADFIEHVLEPELIEQLELLLAKRDEQSVIPPSPHPIGKQGE